MKAAAESSEAGNSSEHPSPWNGQSHRYPAAEHPPDRHPASGRCRLDQGTSTRAQQDPLQHRSEGRWPHHLSWQQRLRVQAAKTRHRG